MRLLPVLPPPAPGVNAIYAARVRAIYPWYPLVPLLTSLTGFPSRETPMRSMRPSGVGSEGATRVASTVAASGFNVFFESASQIWVPAEPVAIRSGAPLLSRSAQYSRAEPSVGRFVDWANS